MTRPLCAPHAPIVMLPRQPHTAGTLSFLPAGLPSDRRSRIAQKYDISSLNGNGVPVGRPLLRGLRRAGDGGGHGWGRGPRGVREVWGDSDVDVSTPRGGVAFPDVGGARDKDFSEILRCVVCLLRCPSLTLTVYVVQEPGPGPGERRADEHERVGAT